MRSRRPGGIRDRGESHASIVTADIFRVDGLYDRIESDASLRPLFGRT
jgi:hypothetical protein